MMIKKEQLEVAYHFPCAIYLIEKPEFIESVLAVSNESLEKKHKERDMDEIYPVYMSDNFPLDPRVQEFAGYVGSTAWNILNEQGYDMQNLELFFTEMWTQEHYKHSSMEQHVHGYGAQIVGFYFLEVPENSSRVLFHDPRAGKVQNDLPERDPNNASIASRMINFEPKPGLLIFTNAWLAHSFTRHASDKPIKFVHFNLNVQLANAASPAAEVV
jgi:uncharacterized protein (TIGR02466 family)